MTIIVARYNENIEWTKDFSKVIIYNKGSKLEGEYNEILLENVGREAHTYYKYIYDNYDKLDDYTIFLQGNPFDHSPNIIENLHKIVNNKKLDIHFEYLSEQLLYCNLTRCKHHDKLPLQAVYNYLFNDNKQNMMFKTNFNFKFGAGAQFIVSRNQILKRPKEFYLKLIKLLEYNVNPMEGYVIERFHKIIFN
jgi:hypothetical protein